MPFDPLHGHAALRRGRWSEAGADYFLTFCTANRQPGLTSIPIQQEIRREAERLTTESLWQVRTATIMPDHLHLLVNLGTETNLAEVVRLFKGRLSPSMRPNGLSWQKAFFDHRLRAAEDMLPIFLYIYLNPYRAGLMSSNEAWPAYYCCPEDWSWFEPLTDESRPFPEWLGYSKPIIGA